MKLWPGVRNVGSVAIRADRLHWLIAEMKRGRWAPVDGGTIQFDSTDGPQPDLIAELWQSRSVKWGLCVPSFAHAGLFTLPPLKDDELTQGIQLQLEKVFEIDSATNHFDYELLPSERSLSFGGRAAMTPNAVMVALPRVDLESWIQWAGRLPYPPQRLEPTLPPLLRAIRKLPQYRTSKGALWIHRDAGGTILLVTSSGQSLAMRDLGPEHRSDSDPLAEDGVPRIKELLLNCEDRYPELEISDFIAMGRCEVDRVTEVATELELSPTCDIPPPFDCPSALLPDTGWLIPFGDLLEVGNHE